MNTMDEDLKTICRIIPRVTAVEKCQSIERMGGMTNRTYKVETDHSKAYVVRIPGEGTESMICRSDEKISTELACHLGIDADLLFWGNGEEEGLKVSSYIQNAVTLNKERMKDSNTIRDIAQVLRKLHTCEVETGVVFDVFAMADTYEKVINAHSINMYSDYFEVRKHVMQIKQQVEKQNAFHIVPCHNDPLPENWVYGNDRLYLIDWEYAGMNDSMWDLADVSIESEYEEEQDMFLLKDYLGHAPDYATKMRFMANKLYVDFVWTLWGKARIPFDGEEMETYALGRYNRLKKNLRIYQQMIGFN